MQSHHVRGKTLILWAFLALAWTSTTVLAEEAAPPNAVWGKALAQEFIKHATPNCDTEETGVCVFTAAPILISVQDSSPDSNPGSKIPTVVTFALFVAKSGALDLRVNLVMRNGNMPQEPFSGIPHIITMDDENADGTLDRISLSVASVSEFSDGSTQLTTTIPNEWSRRASDGCCDALPQAYVRLANQLYPSVMTTILMYLEKGGAAVAPRAMRHVPDSSL